MKHQSSASVRHSASALVAWVRGEHRIGLMTPQVILSALREFLGSDRGVSRRCDGRSLPRVYQKVHRRAAARRAYCD